MTAKTIKRAHPAMRDDIADLTTRRPVPGRDVEQIDPFLFLNHHGPQVYAPHNRGLPFGPHPHRGFETVTFILTGELAHLDSAGHESVIKEGGIQWMTAGSGLVHAEISPEEFKRQGGPLEILQLWVNLPPRLKMTQPRYVGSAARRDPRDYRRRTARASCISSPASGRASRARCSRCSTSSSSTVELAAGAPRRRSPASRKRNVFLYVVRGVDRGRGPARAALALDRAQRGRRFGRDRRRSPTPCCCSVTPSRSARPSSRYGPFVMNTREEIMQAIQDYQAGKFNAIPAGRVA